MSNFPPFKAGEDEFSIFVKDSYGRIVADVRGNGISMEEHRALAKLLAAAPELLSELKAANKIIMNALHIMTVDQKLAWGKRNDKDWVAGSDGGATRSWDRNAVITKAEGK